MLLGTLLAIVVCAGGQSPAQQGVPQSQDPKVAQAEKQHQADLQVDIENGNKYAADVEKQNKLCTDKAIVDRVQRIGAEIAAIANSGAVNCLWGDKRLNKFNYTYKVIQGDDVNAFSLPGGHVYVYEGLVKDVESDDELAGVLGHETAHAAFRHVTTLQHEEQKMMNVSLPIIIASILAGHGSAAGTAIPATQLLMQAKGSGWSVKAEEAADYGGYQFLKKSKYDPTGMLTFMERLAQREKTGLNFDWGIYQTHPPSPERAQSLLKYMKEDSVPIRRSKVTTTFRATVKPANGGVIEIDFGHRPLVAFSGNDALTRADAEADALNAFFDSTPELFEIQPGHSGEVLGRGKPVLTVTKADAAAASMSVDELRDKALANMRIAAFNLGFNIWSSHGSF